MANQRVAVMLLALVIMECSSLPDASKVLIDIQRGMSYEKVLVMAGAYDI